MPKSKTSLNEILHEIRRIEEHRELLTEKKIRKIYKSLLKDLQAFLGDAYIKYADDSGLITVAQLQKKAKLAWFLKEIDKNCNKYLPDVSEEIQKTVNAAYEKCYKGMVEAVKEVSDLSSLNVRPEVLKAAIDNNIDKLTLPDLLEKNRKEIVYNIKQTITIGLMNGERYETLTRELTDKIDIGYRKANNIVRTETHRNVEGGIMDGAISCKEELDGSGLIEVATWISMGDERVRPNRRVKTKKGWKTYRSKNGANHVKMDGQMVAVGEKFKLEDGVYAVCPGKSGTARNDCNCRCVVNYELMTVEEWKKIKKDRGV